MRSRSHWRVRAGAALGMLLACVWTGAAGAETTRAVPYEFSTLGVAPVPSTAAPSLALDRGDPERLLQSASSADLDASHAALNPERAQILLRSLTVPGWGQAQRGHYLAAGIFALAEVGVWTAFTAYTIQSKMRTDAYEHTALDVAGIDLKGRDEEFRRIVGAYISSDEYNQLVVYRDAANLYYDDPAAMRAYIQAHSLGGNDAWSWGSDENLLRYQGQRKQAQRAERRANTTLALAVINRLVSALHAARIGGQEAHEQRPVSIEFGPASATDPTAYRLGVRASF